MPHTKNTKRGYCTQMWKTWNCRGLPSNGEYHFLSEEKRWRVKVLHFCCYYYCYYAKREKTKFDTLMFWPGDATAVTAWVRRGYCRGRVSVNETGWGLVVGECSERMSAKPGIPLIQGPQSETVEEPHTMHGCAIVTATPPSNSSSRGGRWE